MPVAARTHIDTQLRGDGVAGGRCGRNSECLRVPKKQNGQRGTPGGFCSSRKLLLGDCKASGRVRNDACSALAHVGKQAGGRKCSIVLPSTNLGPAGWPRGSTGATEGCVSHRYRGGDFHKELDCTCQGCQERPHYLAVFASHSRRAKKPVFGADRFESKFAFIPERRRFGCDGLEKGSDLAWFTRKCEQGLCTWERPVLSPVRLGQSRGCHMSYVCTSRCARCSGPVGKTGKSRPLPFGKDARRCCFRNSQNSHRTV